MKYLILAYGSQRDFDELMAGSELESIDAFLAAFTAELTASGELLDTQGLAQPKEARLVQMRDGRRVVTDGPYAEAKEVLAGYWLVDCAGIERATDIAAKLFDCPGPIPELGFEVRALLGEEA
ncbi:YciI family protein [Actinomycetes bacterium KLBMP 9759]